MNQTLNSRQHYSRADPLECFCQTVVFAHFGRQNRSRRRACKQGEHSAFGFVNSAANSEAITDVNVRHGRSRKNNLDGGGSIM